MKDFTINILYKITYFLSLNTEIKIDYVPRQGR